MSASPGRTYGTRCGASFLVEFGGPLLGRSCGRVRRCSSLVRGAGARSQRSVHSRGGGGNRLSERVAAVGSTRRGRRCRPRDSAGSCQSIPVPPCARGRRRSPTSTWRRSRTSPPGLLGSASRPIDRDPNRRSASSRVRVQEHGSAEQIRLFWVWVIAVGDRAVLNGP